MTQNIDPQSQPGLTGGGNRAVTIIVAVLIAGILLAIITLGIIVVGRVLSGDEAEDSFNMLPVLLGKSLPGPVRESLILHSDQGMFAIRVGPWKLIRGQGTGSFFTKDPVLPPDAPPGQLYNLADDPKEQKNLYRQRPEVVERLSKMLDEQIAAGRTRPEE